jgi:hypothetical protein
MPLRELLPFGNKKNPFEGWPPVPTVRPITAGRVQEKGLDSAAHISAIYDAYIPTLIIAFGGTGAQALSLLSEKTIQSGCDGKKSLRGFLITETPASLIPSEEFPVRVLELQRSAAAPASTGSLHSLRAGSVGIFRQVINYRRYQEWLQESLLDLGGNVQVFFCGSLSEPVIGILSETLQILRNFPENIGKPNLYSRVIAFLTLQSSIEPNQLPDEEIFASCREIGRLSFPGPHQMNTSYGMNRIVRSALLDAFFLVENRGSAGQTGYAQTLAESLFNLVHPSARQIWENLRNDLSVAGQIHHSTHQAVTNGLGIATLHIPIGPIRRYVAVRLAKAALVGEQLNVAEGLVYQPAAHQEKPSSLAASLLIGGPYLHPIFGWILDATSAADFDIVPDLNAEFIVAFQSQICHGLIRILNTPPADLELICGSMEWLGKHLDLCDEWFKTSNPSNKNSPARFTFQFVLTKWRETVHSLLTELRGWNHAFFSIETPLVSNKEMPSSNWRTGRQTSSWRPVNPQDSQVVVQSISTILAVQRRNAEEVLMAGFNEPVYKSIISDSNGSLNEIETYYADTVRPELSRFTNEPSASFTRIRNRLEWWIRLVPDQVPQLRLVSWPLQAEISPEPPSQFCFKYDQVKDFANAVVDLAFSQTVALESDLTGSWFGQRTLLFVDFLRQAGDAFLKYDRNLANQVNSSSTRRSYLISHDPTLARDIVPHIFPDTPRFEINELDNGESTRLSAMSLRLNVPFSAVDILQEPPRGYVENPPERIHLYAPEQNAMLYEKRFRRLERDRRLLSPDFVHLLANQQLVTLFCQGLYTGVIRVAGDENIGDRSWQVSACEEFPQLTLARVGETGLLAAFMRFVLELPNELDLNQAPQRPFHPARRSQYLLSLTKLVKSRAVDEETRLVREKFRDELDSWRRKGAQDDMARSFFVVLQCEFDEPVWKDW